MTPFTDSADGDRVWDEHGARERSQSVHGAAERAHAARDTPQPGGPATLGLLVCTADAAYRQPAPQLERDSISGDRECS